MRLLDLSMQECVMMDKKTVSDGEGGYLTVYSEGARFMASVVPENQGLDKIARAISEAVTYRVTTRRNVSLSVYDIFRTVGDGQTYRISYSNVQSTPETADLDMRVTTAERWVIPG